MCNETASPCKEIGFVAQFDSNGEGPDGEYSTHPLGVMNSKDITSAVSFNDFALTPTSWNIPLQTTPSFPHV